MEEADTWVPAGGRRDSNKKEVTCPVETRKGQELEVMPDPSHLQSPGKEDKGRPTEHLAKYVSYKPS